MSVDTSGKCSVCGQQSRGDIHICPGLPASTQYQIRWNPTAVGLGQEIAFLHSRLEAAEAALARLTEAADLYRADQSAAPDPRCGLVQPVTVAQAEALNEALDAAWALLDEVTP